MKNTKEILSILKAIYAINGAKYKSEEIEDILKYTFLRCFGANTNILDLIIAVSTEEQLKEGAIELLERDTKISKYIKEMPWYVLGK